MGNPYVGGIKGITLARVDLPNQLEIPGMESRAFVVTTKERKVSSAMWPGPNIEVNAAGTAGGSSTGIHGLYWPPLPGQTVALGFVDGCASAPIVLQRYSTYVSKDPTLESMHFMPITQHLHSARDLVLGHYQGSYLAFRSTSLPGQVDMYAQTLMQLQAMASMTLTAPTVSLVAPTSTSPTQPAVKGTSHVTQIILILAQIIAILQALSGHTHDGVLSGGSTSGGPSNSSDFDNISAAVSALSSTYSASVLSPYIYHS